MNQTTAAAIATRYNHQTSNNSSSSTGTRNDMVFECMNQNHPLNYYLPKYKLSDDNNTIIMNNDHHNSS
jgi:hypothetical protein